MISRIRFQHRPQGNLIEQIFVVRMFDGNQTLINNTQRWAPSFKMILHHSTALLNAFNSPNLTVVTDAEWKFRICLSGPKEIKC